jgi:hypothetical protein
LIWLKSCQAINGEGGGLDTGGAKLVACGRSSPLLSKARIQANILCHALRNRLYPLSAFTLHGVHGSTQFGSVPAESIAATYFALSNEVEMKKLQRIWK